MYLLNSSSNTAQVVVNFENSSDTHGWLDFLYNGGVLWVKSQTLIKLVFNKIPLSGFWLLLVIFLLLVISLLFYMDKVVTISSLVFWINSFFKVSSGNNKTLKDESVFLLLGLWALLEFFFNSSLGGYFSQNIKNIFFIFIPLTLLYVGYICLGLLLGFFLFFVILGYSSKKHFLQKLYADIITVLSFFLRVGIQYIRFIIMVVFLTKFYLELFEYFFLINSPSSLSLVYTPNTVFGLAWGKLMFDFVELSFVALFQMGVFFILFNIVFKSFLLTWGTFKKNE